jgi:hypothetical protein
MEFDQYLARCMEAFYDRGSEWMGTLVKGLIESNATPDDVDRLVAELFDRKQAAMVAKDIVELGYAWSTGDLLGYMMEDWKKLKNF